MAAMQTVPHASTARWKNSSCCTARRSKLADRDALIEKHIVWARRVAAKVASKLPTWFTADDMTGPAAIALLDAASKYDPGRGVPFRAYAIRSVEGACYSAVRRNEYRERAHGELGEETADVQQVAVRHTGLPSAVWLLPPDQFRMIELCYLHDLTVEAAALRMGISPSKASQHHRAALEALRGLIGAAA